MNETKVLLQAYYETLYDRLETRKPLMIDAIDRLLAEEMRKRGYEGFDDEKCAAYREACLAFVDERIEAYNPTGLQYLFDREVARGAFELELQLDWYDSRAEFEVLVAEARRKSADMTDENVHALAEELIGKVGAFPDKSIIAGYEDKPALQKLPDYVVARAIEQVIE
ncbi:MAG: hypothetical protein ACYSWQ_15075 [Planctomycetota bacterium]|jgi:hypothetical protein